MATIIPNALNGTQIGPYRMVKQIGAGGMGAVYLAEHIALGRRAAIKVLHSEFSHRAEIVTRLFNEARAATTISDPGIVQIFEFGHHTDGSPYIVMELLDGETLDRRLERSGPLPVATALRILRQVASSLGAAHARGIVHRDLKPENIFMVRDSEVPGGERPKLLDFGIAKLAGEGIGLKTHTSAVMGTPMYMSPEQCRGAGYVDQRSDVYSLGCVMFALLTGRPPFEAEGVGDIIAMHLREPASAPSRLRSAVSPAVDKLVLRCLAKDPTERFASGTELAFALSAILGSGPDVPIAMVPMRKSVPRRSTPTTLSAASGENGAIASPTRVAMHGALAGGLLGVAIVVFAIRGHAPTATPVAAAMIDAVPQPAAALDARIDTVPPFVAAHSWRRQFRAMARSVEGGCSMRDDETGTLSDVHDVVGVDSALPQSHSVRPVETALPPIDGMYSFDELPTTEYLRPSADDVAVSYATPRVENLDIP